MKIIVDKVSKMLQIKVKNKLLLQFIQEQEPCVSFQDNVKTLIFHYDILSRVHKDLCGIAA